MANVADNVTAGKPSTSGAIWAAIAGSATLPDDTVDALTGFSCLGYCSEDGVTNSTDLETESVKAWGGDIVLTTQTSKEDKFKFKLIEALNADVLKLVFGSGNVSGALSTGLTVNANSKDLDEMSIVIDMILRDSTAKRIVIPNCKVTEISEITYSDSDAVGYEVTMSCTPDATGNTHYEYLKASA